MIISVNLKQNVKMCSKSNAVYAVCKFLTIIFFSPLVDNLKLANDTY